MEPRTKFFIQAQLLWAAFLPLALGQDLVPPYFNIAEKKKVTVNATCGEGISKKEIYCKLVGYDSIISTSDSEIRDGQVNSLSHGTHASLEPRSVPLRIVVYVAL